MSVTISGSGGTYTAEIGTTMPTLTDVGGGWNEITRPRRMSMTEWMGPPATKGTIQLLFNGFETDTSVQGDVEGLVSGYAPPDGTTEPPTFTVDGAWPIPSTTQWVCNGITFDEWIRNNDGTPVRVLLTMVLLAYVSPDVVTNGPGAAGAFGGSTTVGRTASSGAPGAGANGTSTPGAPGGQAQFGGDNSGSRLDGGDQTYTTSPGDTLSSIAARELGNWQLGESIGTLNNIRDGNNIPAGTVLRLP